MAKIGEGHFSAMGRQGLDELRNAVYSESNVAQKQAEYGVYGTRTPGEVAEARREDERGMDEEKTIDRGSILEDRMRQAEGRGVHGRDDKEFEPER